MNVNSFKISFGNWDALKLANDRSSLVIVPNAGGRVLSATFDGVEILFNQTDFSRQNLHLSQATDVRARKRALGWRHYGGYKTWLAPQESWTDKLPFLDLDSGSYTLEIQNWESGPHISVTSPICRETEIQLTRQIAIEAPGSISVTQGMKNFSVKKASWGLWDVTQVRGPGIAILPLHPNSCFAGSIKPYTMEGRSTEVLEKYVTKTSNCAVIDCNQVEPFKYGTDSMEGWILGLLEVEDKSEWLAYLKLFPTDPTGTYPHESVVEVYDSGTLPYFELEAHSHLKTLSPGESYEISEKWVFDWIPKTTEITQIREWANHKRELHLKI